MYGVGSPIVNKLTCGAYLTLLRFTEWLKLLSFNFMLLLSRYRVDRLMLPWKMLLRRRLYRIVTSWQNMYWTSRYSRTVLLARIYLRLWGFSYNSK